MLSTSAPRISTWKQVQAAKEAYSKTTFRQPHFDWRSKDTAKYRAGVTVYLEFTNDQINSKKINVVVTRGFYRGGERRYMHITLASLRRLSRIAPLPLLSNAQFEALDNAAVADEMLQAAHAQQDTFRLIDRVDAAIQIGKLHELTGIEGKEKLEAAK
jgi:hypothetical protein